MEVQSIESIFYVNSVLSFKYVFQFLHERFFLLYLIFLNERCYALTHFVG